LFCPGFLGDLKLGKLQTQNNFEERSHDKFVVFGPPCAAIYVISAVKPKNCQENERTSCQDTDVWEWGDNTIAFLFCPGFLEDLKLGKLQTPNNFEERNHDKFATLIAEFNQMNKQSL